MFNFAVALVTKFQKATLVSLAVIGGLLSTSSALAQIPQSIVFAQPATPVAYSSGMTIPLSATGGGSGNPVVLTLDAATTGTGSITGSTLSVTSAGTFVIDANQAAATNYQAASQVQRTVMVITPITQTITFNQPASPVNYATGLTVNLSATGGGSGNPVVFSVDPGSTGSGSIAGSVLSVLSPGNLVIDANQAGNATYAVASQVQRTIVINPTPQTITFTQPTSPQTYSAGLTIPLNAAGGTSGNPVVFTIDGASTGTGSITGTTLNVTGAGAFIIDANQVGNASFAAAPQVQRQVDINSGSTVTLAPSSVNFGNIATGGPGFTYTVTLKNTGASSVSINSITISPAEYSIIGGGTCAVAGTLTQNQTCSIYISAASPATVGALPAGELTVNTNAPNPDVSIPLSGTGVYPSTLSATSIAFGNVIVGQSGAVHNITLTNNQTTAGLSISSISLPAGGYSFAGTTTCPNPGTLPATKSCVIALKLTPAAVGPVAAGNLTVNSNASNSPQSVALSGAGLPASQLLPALVNFSNVVAGTTSPLTTVTLYNDESTTITIASLQTTAGSPYSIDASSSCNSLTVTASSSCTIKLKASPTAPGTMPPGTLTVTTNALNSPLSIPLTGTAIAPTTVLPASVGFGNVVDGATSPVQTVTLTNHLVTSINISSLSVTAGTPYMIAPTSTCLAPTLAANASCTVNLTVTPTTVGTQPAGILTIATNAPNSPLSVPLSANGITATVLAPAVIAFGNVVESSTSSTKVLRLTNNASSPLALTNQIFNGPFALDTTSAIPGACTISGGALSGSVPAGSSCLIGVVFQPTTISNITNGKITVLDSDPTGPVSAVLEGNGVGPTSLSLASVAFGAVVENTTSATKSVTLTNSQPSTLAISSITAPAPFAVTTGTNACGASLAASSSCVIYLTYSPTGVGAAPPTNLTVQDNATSGPTTLTAALTGTGVLPVTVTPATLAFGNVAIGQKTTMNEVITNNQTTSLSISSITGFSGGYSQSTASTNPCGATLNAGASCNLAISLTATTAGAQPGILSVNDSTATSPQTFNLTANAGSQVVLSNIALTFAPQLEGTTSAAQTVKLTNELSSAITINSVSITGANPNDFGVTSTCPTTPSTLSGMTNCSLFVTFTPTASGSRTALLTINDTATPGAQNVALAGTGNAPVLVTPGTITNFSANVGSTSAYKTITITNAQPSTALTNISFQLSGDFVQTATNCGAAPPYSLAPSATCTVQIEFNPTIGGTRTGQLQVVDSASTSPQVVNLSGSGKNPLTISPALLAFSAQTVNTSSAAKLITLTNHETQSETFSLGTTGNYSAATNCTTGVIAPNSSCNVFVTFTPSSATPATRPGTLSITHSAAIGSPIVAPLTGSAIATNPQPAVQVVSPGAGSAGTTVNVTITGNGWTHFSSNSVISFVDTNSASYPADITVSNFTVVSPNQIDATLVLGQPATNSGYGARNIYVKSPLSGGTTETAFLLSAFIIADPTLSHEITSVTPNFGAQGQTMNVNLVATGTNFNQSTTFANFGDGITVNWLNITSPTTAMATITISNTTSIGYRTITMVTGGEYAVSVLRPDNNPIFQVVSNGSSLSSISPTTGAQGWSGQITVNGTGTHFLQNATKVSIGGVIVGDVNVNSPTQAVAQVAIPANAPIGVQNVSVSTGGEIEGLNNAFTITGATPGLVSVVPSSAQQGQSTTVVITGNAYTNFTACPGGVLTADFTGEISSPTVNVISPTQVSIPISVAQVANVGGITANLTCGQAGSATIFPFSFSVTPSSAQITSVVPNNLPQGAQMQIAVTGLNTNWVQGTTTAAFYPTPIATPSFAEITINSPTSAVLNVIVPTNTPVGNYGFYMATGGETENASIHVYANTPTITMNPANGMVPTNSIVNSFPVNFTGQFTKFSSSTVPVVAGEGVTLTGFTVNSPASASANINIAPGAATGARLVTLTTGAEIDTTYFNVTSTPVGIISINPWHGPQSTNISNIEIVGLNTHWVNGTTQVLFGPQITVNSFNVIDNTHLTANITTSFVDGANTLPTPPGYQAVYVNTGAEQVITGFSVDAPATPSITSVVPNSAQQGSTDTPVTITGNLTNWQQGTSELILGAGVTVANLQITSPTTATATISVYPTAPVGGNSVIMITSSEIDSGTAFSVTPSAALIQSVEPNFNCPPGIYVAANFGCNNGSPTGVPVVGQLHTVTLNIVGVGTHWLQGETTISFGGGVNIDQLTVSSPTTMTAQITVLSSAPVGYASLTTYTGGETVTLQQAIDIEEGSPTLLAISPGSGQQAGNYTLQILGRFTSFQQGVTQVTFNNPDISVVPGSINVIDSENMQVGITVSPWAYVDYGTPCGHEVLVTTGSEQVNTASIQDNFCVTQGAEEITSVSPLSAIQGNTLVVSITGSATNFVAGETQVSFGDANFQVGQINVIDSTHLQVPVGVSTSATTGYKQVTVTTLGQVATQQYSFTVTPGVATLNEAIPNQAEQGAPLATQPPLVVRLLGQYSHFTTQTTATFGAGITVQSVQWISATEVDATINIDPLSYTGGRNVTVATPNVSCAYQPPANANVAGVTYQGCTPGNPNGTGKEIVNANIFSIIPGPAIITSVSPNTGNEGQEIVFNITGLDTHWQQNFTQFYIAGGGSDITVNSVVINSATSATVDINIAPTANPGPRSVYMVTNGESLTDSGAFVVTGGIPVVTGVSPNSALQGTNGLQVTIYGNAYTTWNATSTIGFGPGVSVASYQVDDASHIEAILNIDPAAQVGYRTVTVQTGTQVLTGYFQVTAPAPPPTPYIWYENPSSGIPGQTLTITFYGAYTHWDPNPITGTQLTGFDTNVTVNSFQVTSPTTALANITISPTATAHGYDLTLTTNTVSPTEVDNAGFTIVVAQPTLSVVDPGSAIQGAQNIDVNIIGQFTQFDSTTTFTFGNNGGITVNGPPTILGPTIAVQSISIGIEAPTGGYSVVSTTTDAPAGQQVVGGAGFSVTPGLAVITKISPNTSTQGSTITVDVQGSNTHWAGNTVFQLGAGIVVSSTVVNSATDATLTLVIPPLASEGPTGASATTGGEVAYITNGFVVQAGTPLLLSSEPGSLPQQSSAVFTILSQATNWSNANPPVVSFGNGVVLTNVNVTSPTSMTVDGYVQPTTNVGGRNLTVVTGTQVLNLYGAFYVSPGPAVINSVVANSGGQGATMNVVVNGINTNWQQGVTTLTFPGATVNTLTVNSLTSMTANITISNYAPAGEVTVTAVTAGETATGVNVFTITQTQPEILSVVSTSGTQGQTETVTITGAFTHFSTATSVANFGAGITVNNLNALSATSLQANITVTPTATVGARAVSVTTGAEVVNLNNAFNVTVGPAAIQSLSPASGGEGNTYTVLVTGSQTHFASGVTSASFGGGINVTGITVTDLLHASVNIQIPNSTPTGAYNVTLNTGGEAATILGGFTVNTGSPQISSVSPPTGNQGASNLPVTITGLFTSFVNGTSVANFGSPNISVVSTNVTSPTTAIATINISPTAALTSYNVSVTTGAQVASITGGFTVLAGVPALTSASPTSAQAGTTDNIVVNGVFTTFQQGFSSVTMGSGVTVNFVTVNTTTQLTANITVAANASVGPRDISVTTNGHTQTLSGGLTVTAGTPVITSINPNYGNPAQNNLDVTIYGQYTNWVNGTTVASFGGGIVVNSTTVSNATTLDANISIPSGASLGPVEVTTTTGGEVEMVPGGFTIQAATIPAPTLLSLSPGSNAGGIPINSDFIAVFSQPMNRTTITTSTFILYLTSNPGGWVTVPGTVTVDATGRIATFTPTGLLAVNSQYYVNLTSGIKDATGNTFNNYGVYDSTIDSANTTPVTVSPVNPPPNSTGIGTNVLPAVQFSADMDQGTETGFTVMTGGNPVAGTYSWNSYPYGNPYWGPGTILTFTPTSPLAPNTTYTVAYSNALMDTAGNATTPGSYTFTTGSGPDTAQNYTGLDFNNYIGNVGTNFAPRVNFAKPVNLIDINNSTLLLYNADSGKYVQGTAVVAPDGMSAQFIPQFPLLPDTYYYVHMAWGYYDADGQYLNGVNGYFTTGAASDTTTPTVANISPANNATSVPLNADVIITFSEPIDPQSALNAVTISPAGGGSAISGSSALQSDLVTLIFTPSTTSASLATGLQANTQYNVQVSGFQNLGGVTGTTFNSTFTTAVSPAVINVSTGLDATGHVITTGNTVDAHWTYVPTTGTSGESGFLYPGTNPLKVVAPGDADWYGSWDANGPNSSWIAINPNSAQGNSYGFYSTPFTLPNPLGSAHYCLVGAISHDDNGLLGVNGQAIMGDQGYNAGSLVPLSIDITSYVVAGANSLEFGFGSTDNNLEGLRLQAVVETCGASLLNNLNLISANPTYGQGSVPTSTNITLTFNNPLDPATVNSTSLPVMVGWNSNQEIAGQYVVVGNQVIFTPTTPFPINQQIWVGAYNGPLDLAGDSAATCGTNCYTQLTYFNTAGTATPAGSPLAIVASTPANNATNVGLRAPISATFNRSINLNSLNSGDFAMFIGDGQSPWCTSQVHSQDDTTIQFNCFPLPSSTQLTAFFGSGISDWQGYNNTSTTPITFTTSLYDSNYNGSVTGTRPGNAVSGISANEPITLFFNLPVNAGTATNGIEVAENNQPVPGSVQVLDNGYVLVFTPSTAWTPGALIQWWTTGTLLDTTYNTPINGANGYFFVAGSTSTIAPNFQTVSPANGSTIPTNAVYDLQFNTPLNASTVNSTNIYIYDGHTGLHVAATYSMPQPNEVRIVPTNPVSPSSYMYLYITTGLQSATSVPVASQTYVYFYTNSGIDATTPTVVSAVPYNGATNVGINAAPGIVFSKAMDAVSVTPSSFQVLQGANPLPGTFWFSSNDTRIEFIPNDALPSGATLTMQLNGVLDQVGNPINYTSTFQTASGPDYSQPVVVSTSIPTNGSVPTNTTITAQFSASMDVTTFGAGQPGACSDFYIYDTLTGQCIATTLSWNSTQSTAYLTPVSPLSAGREYYLYINGGTDINGNALSGFEQTFYAEFSSAGAAPAVTHFNPLSNATGVGTNVIIEAQFSAPIDATTLGNVTLTTGGNPVTTSPSMSAGNTVLQLVPATPLAPGTTYVMTIAGVKDPAGHALATATNTFTTGATYDNSAPSAINSDPSSNTTVGINVSPKFVFNKPLNPMTVNGGTFRLYVYDTGQPIPVVVTPSANGLEVTMTPQLALQPGTRYHFQACCGYQDQDGNNGNESDIYFWTNGGAVTAGPTVSVSPANGATGIPQNAQVIVTVSAPVDPTTIGQNAIQVLDPSSNPVAGTVSLAAVQQINFAPTSPLLAGTTYTVNVNNFTDANGNAVQAYTGTFTTGSAAITTGLSITGQNPTYGATNVNETQAITLTFSQPLDSSTVNGNTLIVMDGWNSNYQLAGTWTIPNPATPNIAQFTPANAYPPGAQIFVGSCPGPTDLLGEVLNNGACYSQYLEYFTVNSASPDTTPLSVLSVSPSPGATNVTPDSSVSITFNKAINPYTVYNNNNNALLFAGEGLQDRGSITMSNDGRTLTFNAGNLYQNTVYTIELPANGIADPSGNALTSTYTSTFTTGANPATGNGSVQGNVPSNNASGVPATTLLTLYLNRQVNPSSVAGNLVVTVNGQVYPGSLQTLADGYEIQYTPNTQFPAGATVQWFFSNVYDIYGDVFNGTSNVFYTASTINASTAAPTVISVSPACCNSQVVPTNSEVDIQYTLPIDATTLAGNVYENTGPAAAFTLSLVSPTVVRISPPAGGWNPSTQYGFCTNTSVKGTNGVAAQNYCWLTYFTTTTASDSTPGTVIIGPPNNATNVGTNAYLRFQFSKPVDRSSITSSTIQIMAGGNPIPGTWSFNYSNADLYGVNFSPLNPLPPSTTISIVTNGVLDYAGNIFTPKSTSFTTAATPDYSQPSVSLNFGGNTSNVATNASFTCIYSEAMDPSSISDGNTYLYSYVTNAHVPVTYSWASNLMSVTLTPTQPLFASTEYNFYCQGGIDLTGNGQSGASSYFYTGAGPSNAGPALVAANPPSGMTAAAINTIYGPWNSTSLQVQFNEPVSSDTIGNLTLTPQGGSPMAIGVTPEWGNTIAVVNLPYTLSPNTTYTYNIAGVTDYNGNPASGTTTSSFTTGSAFDWSNPGVASALPANSSTGVAVSGATLSVTFNEVMDPVLIDTNHIYLRTHNTQTLVPTTLAISNDFVGNTTTVTLTPAAALTGTTIYDIVVTNPYWCMTDVAGNNINNCGAQVPTTFTTAAAPVINGACGSANGQTFTAVGAVNPANLCSAGSVSGQTNNGTYSWTCNGSGGGTNASCSATITPANACYAQSNLPANSLIGWWKGDDDATDHTGNGNNGTLENFGPTPFVTAEVNDGFNLSGNSTNADQYVMIGTPVPNDLQIQNAITLQAWIYPTQLPVNYGSGALGLIVGSQHDGTTSGATIFFDGNTNSDGVNGVPPGHIQFQIGNGSWHETDSLTQLPLNQWTLVTATRTANNAAQIYYNGIAQPTEDVESAWNGTVTYSGSWFAIGQQSDYNRQFIGAIDEVQVFNQALTQAQIQAIFTAGNAGICP